MIRIEEAHVVGSLALRPSATAMLIGVSTSIPQ
jgi:hypothetical protein